MKNGLSIYSGYLIPKFSPRYRACVASLIAEFGLIPACLISPCLIDKEIEVLNKVEMSHEQFDVDNGTRYYIRKRIYEACSSPAVYPELPFYENR